MSSPYNVRASRDGDQFHYLWAARRCLALLQPNGALVSIAIEGPSPNEQPTDSPPLAGECAIDIAEYEGSEDLEGATTVRYLQLKHSTAQSHRDWTKSGIKPTVTDFAERYRGLVERFGADDVRRRFEFWFVTNRPVVNTVRQAVAHAATGLSSCRSEEIGMLRYLTGLSDSLIAGFCGCLRLEDGQAGFLDQRNSLIEELDAFLPDAGNEALLPLKELISSRATTEFAHRPTINRTDVLGALHTDQGRLYPAPCLIERIEKAIQREQDSELISSIISAGTRPVIVHALSGIGKSIFASQLPEALPSGSAAVVYDCFGNGGYRTSAHPRHRNRDALVQIANELACRGLCNLLVPSPHSDRSSYMRAFVERMRQGVGRLRAATPDALLVVVLDAADNAQMAAELSNDGRSFACDLLREPLPDGVRVVALCRTHRIPSLDPPSTAVHLELKPFSMTESAAHLRQEFPGATEIEVREFDRLTSSNPRVQAQALSDGLSLPKVLSSLAPGPRTVDDAMDRLLEKAVSTILDDNVFHEREQIGELCVALAALRPPVPIPILAQVSDVPEAAIKSFALDLHRNLLLNGQALQFRDEPTETWFRERYRPQRNDWAAFIDRIRIQARTSAYAASVLPQLLLEADQLSELVALALGSDGLPGANEIERREVELQRCLFALKASLRSQKYSEAAKLAMKAGGLAASDDRRRELIRSNTDLAARFMASSQVEEAAAKWDLGAGWQGSHHAYAAGLLSCRADLAGYAASRLRQAEDWLGSWSRLPSEKRKEQAVSVDDIAELALANFNLHGADAAARFIRAWRSPRVRFMAGRVACRRLIDLGRLDDVSAIAVSARNDSCLILAAAVELRAVQAPPPSDAVERALGLVLKSKTTRDADINHEETPLDAITALVEASITLNVCSRPIAVVLLGRFLPAEPPRWFSHNYQNQTSILLRAYCLRAALEGKAVEVGDLARADLKAALEKNKENSSLEARDFRESVGALVPWYQLWARTVVGDVGEEQLDAEIDRARQLLADNRRSSYNEDLAVPNQVAALWCDVLLRVGGGSKARFERFERWVDELPRPLFVGTLTDLARACAQRSETGWLSLKIAANAFQLVRDERVADGEAPQNERAPADDKAADFVSIARAVFALSATEAQGYFNEAVQVVSRVGEENLYRWDALIDLADRAARSHRRGAEIAYRFARCAELTYAYVVRDKHFDWGATVEALSALCPRSALAILSRWRDRRFGRNARNLATAIEAMIARGDLDPRDAFPLIAFGARWDYPQMLEATLVRCGSEAQRSRSASFFSRHVEWDEVQAADLVKLEAIAKTHFIEIPQLATTLAFRQAGDSGDRGPTPVDLAFKIDDSRPEPDWDVVFAHCDFTATGCLERSHGRCAGGARYIAFERFFGVAAERVPPGSEPAFIEAIGQMQAFQPLDIGLFKKLPTAWTSRPAVRQSIGVALRDVCRRHCMRVCGDRYTTRFGLAHLKDVCDAAGVDYRNVVAVVLDATAEGVEDDTSERIFSRIGLIAEMITEDEAHDALLYGLDLLEPVLELSDGDGPWSESLCPPATVEKSLAGLIHAALASPVVAVRWEAAHVVLGFCALTRKNVTRELVERIESVSSGCFVDRRVPFYNLHAHQWLLIGLARAALEFPESVAPFASKLTDWALRQRHVMIRHFAAQAVLALKRQNAASLNPETAKELQVVNRSPFPVIEIVQHVAENEEPPSGATDDWLFEPDIGPYWYEPLGRVFGLPRRSVENLALAKIRGELKLAANGRWSDDPRARLKLYDDRQTWASHGAYPAADDYSFYAEYHAMMMIAADLLADRPVHREFPSDGEEPFVEWLARHDLSRGDGRWLADRRDPTPLERHGWRNRDRNGTKYGAITETDFNESLRDGGRWAIWGNWTEIESERVQRVTVRSALVSPGTSMALLRALSSARNPHDYRIPSAGDQLEFDISGYVLKGWIEASNRDRGPGQMDPWCGDVSFPPPGPSPEVAGTMMLTTDPDRRVWQDPKGKPVMLSRAWGTHRGDPNYGEHPHGEGLEASHEYICEMLNRFRLSLILEVEIERRGRTTKFSGQARKDEREPRRTKLYLLRADGSTATV